MTRMRPDIVVVPTPVLYRHLSLESGPEPFQAQTLVTELAVK
jgi:hypothetical protein